MKKLLIILGILISINFVITGICRAVAGNSQINLSNDIIIGELKSGL